MTMHSTQRRRALGALATLGAAGLAGCATGGGSASASKGKVVVIGGGFGGATAAKYVRMWSEGAIDVTLVERGDAFVSCPLSNLVLAGYKQLPEITVPYASLAKNHGVKVVKGEAVAIDAEKRQVRLADGTALPYDRLVVSPGVDFLFDQVPGLKAADAQSRVLHAWKAGPQTVALRKQLEAMPDGGTFAIAIPKAPYRCPPGPYERAAVVASWFRQAKPRSKVLVLDANPEIVSKKGLFERVFKEQYGSILEYRANTEVKDVDAKTLTAITDFDRIRADVLNVIPPQRAADVAANAGLISVNDRWVGIDWLTMESEKVKGVHVIGDATFAAPLMPKSGHMANQHAKLAAAAIVNLLSGRAPNPQPLVMNTCYSFTSRDEAIHVASVHRYDAEKRTVVTVPGSGGVSSAPSAQEARYALSWADNVWADMLV